MTPIDTVLYTASTHTTGGRAGAGRSSDGRLDVTLSPPGGAGGGTNPQLFAVGWSACFIGAMGRAAPSLQVAFPADTAVDAEVDLATAGDQFLLRARLAISLPGLAPDVARTVVETAHRICPYSRATRGNIDVTLNVV